MTKFSYATDSSGPDASKRGTFSIGDTVAAYAFGIEETGSYPYEFSHWMEEYEYEPGKKATRGLPTVESGDCIIKDAITIVAFFGTRGNVDYHIKYYFQTLDSAESGTAPTIPTADPDAEHSGDWVA